MGRSIQSRLRVERPTLQQIAGKRKRQAEHAAAYGGADWQAIRRAHIAKNPACVQCGRIEQNNHVDHIVAHRGDERLRMDPNNLQTLCHSCHSRKTAKHDRGFGNR